MTLDDLTDEETVVLFGFLREVVQADGRYTEEESSEIGRIRDALGRERFDRATELTRETIDSRTTLKERAKAVSRPEARQVILDALIHLSAVDGVDDGEEKPLRWLVSYWGAPSEPEG
jgi:hypothetical protein